MIWSEVREAYPDQWREFYYVHTSRKHLDIRERHWIGIRRSEVV